MTALVGMAPGHAATPSPPASVPTAAPEGFPHLADVSSRFGVLKLTLTAAPKSVTVDGVQLDALVFNGAYGGPVLRVHPGDRMEIRLVNQLDKPVNLHFHGSHGSPLGRGDNMHIVVQPGDSFDYRIQVPRTQPPGLYWYHTHIHGIAEDQVGRGLSGAMIVEGLTRAVKETSGRRERLMVLKTFAVDRPDDPAVKRLHGVIQSINGAAHSELALKAGETELWRISNQAPNDYYHLSIKGFRFRIVALDGAPTNRDIETDKLEIPPAGRVEVLATAPAAGDYPLLSGATPTGSGRNLKVYRELAMVHVSGETRPQPAAAPARKPLTSDLRDAKVTASREFTFAQKPGEEVYMINGRTFDHARLDTRVPLGSIEEWTIRNDTDDMHVFHIHQVHFQVVAINGQLQPFESVLDTVRVPERGSVTIRIPFTDPKIVGRFMYHCHVLKHEDKGMMANIEVYDPKSEADSRNAAEHDAHMQ